MNKTNNLIYLIIIIFTVRQRPNQFKPRTHLKITYVKINEASSSKFTAQVKIKITHNATLEQNADII